ncbi:MAG: endonuclease/exonuclease/phosphatase family protein, partial [Actinobacteria bacterium]|nr:endonuclease/exonuclease/phosphatase family protein [Actinomycetota bacterium]
APPEARRPAATAGDLRVVSTDGPNGQALHSPAFAQQLAFLAAMRARAAALAGHPTVIAGDLNECPADLDVWDTSAVHGATHITDDERRRLRAVLDTGYIDAFRTVHPDEPGFTWWDYRAGHFHKGFGLRIDLALLSEPLSSHLVASSVERPYRKPSKVPGTKPSDHAPLVVDLHDDPRP